MHHVLQAFHPMSILQQQNQSTATKSINMMQDHSPVNERPASFWPLFFPIDCRLVFIHSSSFKTQGKANFAWGLPLTDEPDTQQLCWIPLVKDWVRYSTPELTLPYLCSNPSALKIFNFRCSASGCGGMALLIFEVRSI